MKYIYQFTCQSVFMIYLSINVFPSDFQCIEGIDDVMKVDTFQDFRFDAQKRRICQSAHGLVLRLILR